MISVKPAAHKLHGWHVLSDDRPQKFWQQLFHSSLVAELVGLPGQAAPLHDGAGLLQTRPWFLVCALPQPAGVHSDHVNQSLHPPLIGQQSVRVFTAEPSHEEPPHDGDGLEQERYWLRVPHVAVQPPQLLQLPLTARNAVRVFVSTDSPSHHAPKQRLSVPAG